MALTQKVLTLAAGLALAVSTGCSYNLIYKDGNCTMEATDEGVYRLQHQKVDGIFKPEQTYVFEVNATGTPTEVLRFEDDRNWLGRRVVYDQEFDPENKLPVILSRLKSSDGPYRSCQEELTESLKR